MASFRISASKFSPAVYFGPYRTLFNAPAEITLPFDPESVADVTKIRPYVFNEITASYEAVHEVSGAGKLRVDAERGVVSFDVQVLGIFVLAE